MFNKSTTDDLCADVGAGHITGLSVVEAVFPGIKEENKRYELGTWTTKESAARAHDAALLFMRGDTKETREMMNFPVSEYESTLKDLKDMNVVTTNEEFVELLVESSVKVERRQSRHRGVVKSKEHTNKYEARIFLDET